MLKYLDVMASYRDKWVKQKGPYFGEIFLGKTSVFYYQVFFVKKQAGLKQACFDMSYT